MMSSVPYVPPDTMKNVAATSGQSVSFAFLFVEVTARAGNWAGRDKVLNFLSRPPSAILALSQPHAGASLHHAEYGYSPLMQEKCAKNQRIFRRNVRYGGRRFTPQLSVASARSFTSRRAPDARRSICPRRRLCSGRFSFIEPGSPRRNQ